MSAEREIRVGVRELRWELSRFLNEARGGTSVLVTSNGEVIAERRATPSVTQSPRRPGRLKGKIWMAEDFDVWPEDMLDAMEAWNH